VAGHLTEGSAVATTHATVDDYIGSYPEEVRVVLAEVRRTIHNTIPAAEEKISYQIPTFTLDGKYLVYFAGWKHHVSVYPVPADDALAEELAPYRAAKGTVKFPLNQPIPYDLIARLVTALVEQRQAG
jgi:uncharacterized protein YdhG (YjbR/CyaY superfamily)